MSCRDSWVSAELILVVGDRDSGKTTTLEALRSSYRAKNHEIGGFLALANPEKTWYRLKDLSSTESRLALSSQINLGTERIGRFSISSDVFAWANALIEQSMATTELIVFDEIGKLELQGGGLAPSFRKALDETSCNILASVRDEHVEAVLKCFAIDASHLSIVKVEKEE